MAHFQFGTDGQSNGGGGAGGTNGGGVAGFPGFGMPSQQSSIFAQNTAQPLENSRHRNIHTTSSRAATAQNTEFSMTSRSPPTNTPSSYGNFIPKRGRHGSIGGGGGSSVGSVGSLGRVSSSSLSGRLRSVSDLERMGVVSHMQKGRLKDLLINGDESLRIALEKYEAGDLSKDEYKDLLEGLKLEEIIYETEEELKILHEKVGSYEGLINKRAQLLKQRNIDYKKLEEKDFKNLLLEHYTFIKRPILMYDEKIFVGNSPKTILEAIKFINE